MSIQILMQALRVVDVPREGIEPVEAAGPRVVVPRPQVLQAGGGVGLLARVQERGQRRAGQARAGETIAVGIVRAGLIGARLVCERLTRGIDQPAGAAVAVVEEIVEGGRKSGDPVGTRLCRRWNSV